MHNAGINAEEALCQAQDAQIEETQHGPSLVETDEDKIMNELTFNLPDEGLTVALMAALSDARNDTAMPVIPQDQAPDHAVDEDGGQRYLT